MPLARIDLPPLARSETPPLLVLLHGLGADEHDLLPLAAELDPRFAVTSLRAPLEAEPWGPAWYAVDFRARPPAADLAQAEASRRLLVEALQGLAAARGTAPERTYLLGFSQGATMALAVALTRPELVAGVVIHSGRALPGLAAPAAPPAALSHLHALVVHGADDDVVPAAAGREIRDLLAPLLGARLQHREHPGGHGISADTLADVRGWLAARLR